MPQTRVLFFAEDERVPVLEWLEELEERDPDAYEKCAARIELLEQSGHELRRPTADYLEDGIYELRAKRGRVQYRILYAFSRRSRNVAVLLHALTKEDKVPRTELNRAKQRMARFDDDPAAHTYQG